MPCLGEKRKSKAVFGPGSVMAQKIEQEGDMLE
jgi:hypothetical protein